jgi:hypothetical protein
MNDTVEYFLHTNPAFPWSLDGVGLPLLAVVAGLLVALTVWTYKGHPRATRGRILLLMSLRLLALLLVLLTAVRPSLGIREQPKLPSFLLIGVDLSESMTVTDELGSAARIDAVRKALDRAAPLLDELKAEQNVSVIVYAFGSPDFQEAAGLYDPNAPAVGKSDYGTYLLRTLERWQGQPFVRGHLIIGDGADNGAIVSAIEQAVKWKAVTPMHTFLVGTTTPPGAARDVAISEVACDPNPVAIKTEFTLRARVNSFGFQGEVPVRVQYDLGDGKGYADVRIETQKLKEGKDNVVELRLKAPEQLPESPDQKTLKQIKVRVEIPVTDVPGDVNAANNVLETYLDLTKEGLRVLVVDRFRYEYALILDALSADPRIDVRKVDLQSDEGGPGLLDAFNFAERSYDVMILGNVTAKQLTAIDPKLPERIRDQVLKKGMGFMMIGGHATFAGDSNYADATGWNGTTAIEEILPVNLPPRTKDTTPETTRYQFVVNPRLADTFFLKLADTPAESRQLWDRLNDKPNKSRFTGLSKLGTPKPGAEVYAYASDSDVLFDAGNVQAMSALPPLLVGHQIGDGSRGRVLAFGAMDTMTWQRLGLPATTDGKKLHGRFWRQMALWLAHQDVDDGAAFARPEFPRVAVGGKQGIRVGLRGPNGGAVADAQFQVKVFGPNETEATAKVQTVVIDPNGGNKVNYQPTAPGEYTVKLVASGKTPDGKEAKGEASAKFLSYAEVSEEMVRTAADPEFLQKLASSGGGRAYRLDDLAGYLKELKGQPLVTVKPKPRYLPSWEPKREHAFLPSWLVAFAVLLGVEWGLRRWWGMV